MDKKEKGDRRDAGSAAATSRGAPVPPVTVTSKVTASGGSRDQGGRGRVPKRAEAAPGDVAPKGGADSEPGGSVLGPAAVESASVLTGKSLADARIAENGQKFEEGLYLGTERNVSVRSAGKTPPGERGEDSDGDSVISERPTSRKRAPQHTVGPPKSVGPPNSSRRGEAIDDAASAIPSMHPNTRTFLVRVGRPSPDLPSVDGVADRVVRDMREGLDEAVERHGAAVRAVFKRPIPFDSANKFKRASMLDLMDPIGSEVLGEELWNRFGVGAGEQKGRFLLVTGVSGVGKTRAAYDLGRKRALVVISRIVEKDCRTRPWDIYVDLLHAVVSRSPDPVPLETRKGLLRTLRIVFGAHLEWILDCMDKIHEKMQGAEGGETAAFEWWLEAALRVQRNGLAYSHVAARLQKKLCDLLEKGKCVSEDGAFEMQEEVVEAYISSLHARAIRIFDRDIQIVWAHDEAQALLGNQGLPTDLFQGAFESNTPEGGDKEPYGCFYALLAAARQLSNQTGAMHLILGIKAELSDELLGRHSPAQGLSHCLTYTHHTTVGDLRVWFERYLSDDAMCGVSDAALEPLTGRPLFAAEFWINLLRGCEKERGGVDAEGAARLVRSAIEFTAETGQSQLQTMMKTLWEKRGARADAVRFAFHEIVMSSDGHLGTRGERCLQHAVELGILNARPGECVLKAEPRVTRALRVVGMAKVKAGRDGVQDLLASRMTASPGGEVADYGPALEDCFAWDVVRRCLRTDSGQMTLHELLAPYLVAACNEDWVVDSLPAELSTLFVRVNAGVRCDGKKWGRESPLSLLTVEATQRCLLHHTTNGMAGADTIIPVEDSEGNLRLCIVQHKNRGAKFRLEEAMSSLDIGRWFHGHPHRELRNHHLELLHNQSAFCRPIRVVISARTVHPQLACDLAWLNHTDLSSSPVLIGRANREAIGVDIAPPGADTVIYVPRARWPAFLWPAPDSVAALSSLPVSESKLLRICDGCVPVTFQGNHYHEEIEAAILQVVTRGVGVRFERLARFRPTRTVRAIFTDPYTAIEGLTALREKIADIIITLNPTTPP